MHHFFDAYADELASGSHTEILVSLAALHSDLRRAATSFRTVNQGILESLLQEESLAS